MGGRTAVLTPVVGQYALHLDAMLFVEGQRLVVQDRDGGFRHPARVQKAEAEATEGVHHRMEVDLADALDRTDKQIVLTEQFARP